MPPKRSNFMNYSEEAMQAAVESVKVHKQPQREAARLHGVPPSTLRDRLKGRKPFHEVERTVITAREEERLVAWIKESARKGFGRSMSHIQRAVQKLLNQWGVVTVFTNNLPGPTWVKMFLKRHPDLFATPETVQETLKSEPTTEQIPGETTHDALTTDNMTVSVIPSPTTYPTALPPLSPSTVDPPSPTTSTALPSLSLSPPVELPTTSPRLISPHSASPAPGLISLPLSTFRPSLLPSSASSTAMPTTHAPPSTSFSDPSDFDHIPPGQALDRLLDLTAKVGVNGLIRYRILHTLGTKTDDPEERLFCGLYSSILSGLRQTKTVDNLSTSTVTADNDNLDPLQLPTKWRPNKRVLLQPPKMVSSDRFKKYTTDESNKKTRLEEKKRNKEEREEKKKRVEKEDERKKEPERKKREHEEKRKEKEIGQKAMKRMKKTPTPKRQTDNEDRDTVTITV